MKAIEVFKTAVKSLSIRVCLFIFSVLMLYHTVFAILGYTEPIDVALYILIIPLLYLWCYRNIKYKIYIIETILLSVLVVISYLSSQLYAMIIPILIGLIVLWITYIKNSDFSPIKKILFVVSNLVVVSAVYIFQLGYNPIVTAKYEIYEPLRLIDAWESVVVKHNKKYGVINAISGVELLPMHFDSIEGNSLSINLTPKQQKYIESIGLDTLGIVSYSKNKLYVNRFILSKFDNVMTKREIGNYISEQYDSLDFEIRRLFRQIHIDWINNLVSTVVEGDTSLYKNKCDSVLASLGSILLKSDSLVVNNIKTKVDSISRYTNLETSFGNRDLTELKHSIIQTIIYLQLKESLTSNNADGRLFPLFCISEKIMAYNDNIVRPGNIYSHLNMNIAIDDSGALFNEDISLTLTSNDVVNRNNNKYNDFFYVSTSFLMSDKYINKVIAQKDHNIKKITEFILKSKYRRNSLKSLSNEELIAMIQEGVTLAKTTLNGYFSEKPKSEFEKFLFNDIMALLKTILSESKLISYHSEAILIYERLTICSFIRNMDTKCYIEELDKYYQRKSSKTKEIMDIINVGNNINKRRLEELVLIEETI